MDLNSQADTFVFKGARMDETEKYKQRLEAIAEKRRLQEEQDKAKREQEDEKLRLQQLKRKSLRDQWLMEGAPSSPTSLEAQSPRSPPPWGSQTQDTEQNNDELQSEHQPLAEEEEEAEDLTEELLNLAVDEAEIVQIAVQNGENPNQSETAADKVKVNGGEIEASMNHSASEQNSPPISNGYIGASAGVVGVESDLGFSVGEAEPGQMPYDEEEEEEEEGILVMRAECVIITDEGDDASQEDNQESVQLESVHLLNPEEGREVAEAMQEEENSETAPETITVSKNSAASELPTEAQPAAENRDNEDSSENRDGETEVEGQERELEDPATVQLQSPSDPLEGATVALVPVYSEAQISIPSPESEAEASAAAEGAEAALSEAKGPACPPGHFQDVSLVDPQENHRTKDGPGERELLLSEVKAPVSTTAEPAGVDRAEKQSPSRAQQGQKNCSCCSVM